MSVQSTNDDHLSPETKMTTVTAPYCSGVCQSSTKDSSFMRVAIQGTFERSTANLKNFRLRKNYGKASDRFRKLTLENRRTNLENLSF